MADLLYVCASLTICAATHGSCNLMYQIEISGPIPSVSSLTHLCTNYIIQSIIVKHSESSYFTAENCVQNLLLFS